jgi:Mini-chromosome maintenance replisome factor
MLHVSMAPRLHCISYRRLGSSYPLLHPVHVPDYMESKADDNLIESANQSVTLWGDQTATHAAVSSTENKATKEWILNRIAKVLGGDRTAAEYVLLSVLSRTYGRDDTGANLLLGTLSITLNGFTVGDSRIEKLKEALSEFVPLCVKVIISFFLILQVVNFVFEFYT